MTLPLSTTLSSSCEAPLIRIRSYNFYNIQTQMVKKAKIRVDDKSKKNYAVASPVISIFFVSVSASNVLLKHWYFSISQPLKTPAEVMNSCVPHHKFCNDNCKGINRITEAIVIASALHATVRKLFLLLTNENHYFNFLWK